MPRPSESGMETSELQVAAKPAIIIGLGLLVAGVAAPALPFAAPIAAGALEIGKYLVSLAFGGYVGSRTLLKGIDAIKGDKPKAKKETPNPVE